MSAIYGVNVRDRLLNYQISKFKLSNMVIGDILVKYGNQSTK